jgi:hypothetical protein
LQSSDDETPSLIPTFVRLHMNEYSASRSVYAGRRRNFSIGAAPPRFRLEDSAFSIDFASKEAKEPLRISDAILGLPLENWRCNMRASLKRTVVGSLAALALGISTVAASAQGNNNNPGNWQHGQHMQGGGNWQGHGHNGGGHWHNGAWVPAAIGLGILGLAAGAAAGAAEGPYDDGPADDCMQPRPVYDAYGNYMGRRLVNVC